MVLIKTGASCSSSGVYIISGHMNVDESVRCSLVAEKVLQHSTRLSFFQELVEMHEFCQKSGATTV